MIVKTLQYLVPDAEFVVRGTPKDADEYAENVEWHDPRPQPSWDDIQAAQATVEKNEATAEAKEQRAVAYREEADPLFFGWQRGEKTEEEWLDKVAEIRARYPYPA
jgi:hypothetical protein